MKQYKQISENILKLRSFDKLDERLLRNKWIPFGTCLWWHPKLPRQLYQTKQQALEIQKQWSKHGSKKQHVGG